MIWRLLVGFITIIATLVVLWLLEERDAQSQTVACVDEKTRGVIREMALESIDQGYRNHVIHLFDIWVKDPSDQPKRASRGMQAGIQAYIRARADTFKWDPPVCE